MNILSYMQRIGRSLMVPVATLPAAAILVGIGYWLTSSDNPTIQTISAFLQSSGLAIVSGSSMGILFAIGVAYGMSKDKDGSAALAGLVGWLVVTTLLKPENIAAIEHIDVAAVPMAFTKIENQFIGILIGLIAAGIYNRFCQVELIKALAFFSGRRLVPILTSLAMLVVTVILLYVWPLIYDYLILFGDSIKDLGAVGAGIYGFLNRLLIPVGLHHALNSVFWFDVAGINDIGNFYGGEKAIEAGTAIVGITGRYQAGFFPIMMFGLPGAALAFYHTAKKENKSKVASLMIAVSISSFLTGITEPIEFSFMYAAPLLYLVHAVLTGISVFIAASMHWISGFSFSAGFIDLMFSSKNPLAVHWYMLLVQGLVFFVLYYVIFRALIVKFNLKTPGRDEEQSDSTDKLANGATLAENTKNDQKELAKAFIAALGGADNLTEIDACITRLRLKVKDSALIDEVESKRLGAAAVIKLNKNSAQIVLGPIAEGIAYAMREVINEQKEEH